MMHLIVGISVMAIGVFFTTYGVWVGLGLFQQTNLRRSIVDNLEVISTHYRAVREQIGRPPAVGELDYPPSRFDTAELTWTYSISGGLPTSTATVCVYADGSRPARVRAFSRAAEEMGATTGPDCGVAGAATVARVALWKVL